MIDKRFQIHQQIGKGAFSKVYLGTDMIDLTSVAIKVESPNITKPQLENESKLYSTIQIHKNFQKVVWSGF